MNLITRFLRAWQGGLVSGGFVARTSSSAALDQCLDKL